ncbi:winged helix DNA-binding domain-containing protein [Nocardioides sp. MAHUQ-72]|uniref:winged helix DNA-binding domain-containing protein n=1 Tax=unclassified Nocardioides TaxID=2615069 RepID=UPI003607B77E
MLLSRRRLNRTLLQRQHLLERAVSSADDMVHHLVGMQAQETLPPYLSLHARLTAFDPYDVSRGLDERGLVRLLTMRGTIHLLTPEDALALRPWVQPVMDRSIRSNQAVRAVSHLDREAFGRAVEAVLADGPLAQKDLGPALERHFPGLPATALAQLARVAAPLVQLPPRGKWKQPGGVVYDHVERWTGAASARADPADVVRRYLRAFGPGTAADVTAWSGVTGLTGVLRGMADLVRHQDEAGRPLYDVPNAEPADEDAHAPVRLLGTYDNLWLSHAGRDRVTTPENRRRWMGTNGGTGHTVFVDGMLEGLWRVADGRVEVIELFRDLTRAERDELDAEIASVEALLAR